MTFIIDGQSFDDVGVIKLTENFELKERTQNGYSTATGTRIRNIIGTFVTYNMTIDFKRYDISTRRALMKHLIAPVEFHTFTLPLDVGDMIDYTFEGSINTLSSELLRQRNINEWGQIALTIQAKERLPDGLFT